MIRFILIFFSLSLFSCSVQQRAKTLLRSGYKKIEKAARLDPSVIDSIKKVKDIPVEVPGASGQKEIKTSLDSILFERQLWLYDSLSEKHNELKYKLDSALKFNQSKNTPSIEKRKSDLSSTKKSLDKVKSKLFYGFGKDSVYHFEDSLMVFDVHLKDGQPVMIKHKVKDRKINVKVATVDVNLDASPSFWRSTWFWPGLSLIMLLLIIIIVLLKRR